MSPHQVIVHAGPTISPDEVRRVLPEARVRPPVARGDLFMGEWRRGDTAVIIDGYYRERLSVGHKEILWLLGEGVDVIGAASMGALRAAELTAYGMRGAGSVFRKFASGELDGDDEVAVLHGPAVMGYTPSTVALVNIRYGCAEGVRANLLPAAAGERIVEAVRARPFTHRTWHEIGAELGPDFHGPLETLRQGIEAGEWDLKRLDALAALRSAVGRPPGAPAAAAAGAATGITGNELLKWRSMREYAPDRRMSDLDVLNAARLFDEDYPALHERVLTELLAEFAGERGLGLEAYVRGKLGHRDGSALAGNLKAWLSASEAAALPVTEQLRLIMLRVWPVWQSADWRPAVLAKLKASGGWQRWADVVVRADDAVEETRGQLVIPPPELCARLWLRHWLHGGTSADVELGRRGFSGAEELGRTVRRFFALDVRRGRAGGGRP